MCTIHVGPSQQKFLKIMVSQNPQRLSYVKLSQILQLWAAENFDGLDQRASENNPDKIYDHNFEIM